MNQDSKIRKILEEAVRAPSVDNCQPWLFTLENDRLHIYLDKKRADFFGDYNFSAAYVTLGALIENITVAASRYEAGCDVALFPRGGTETPVASLRFTENKNEKSPLFDSIAERCTNRTKYKRTKLEPGVVSELDNIPKTPGASLTLITNAKTIREISDMAATVDRIIFEHEVLHQHLFKWVRWSSAEIEKTLDGMPVDCLGLSAPEKKFFRAISSWPLMNLLNKVGMGWLIGKVNSSLLRNSSALGLVFMDKNSMVDYVNGGRFFERVWLKATSLGLALHPLGGIPFLVTRMLHAGDEGFNPRHYAALQDVFKKMTGLFPVTRDNAIIILFRLGYAEKPACRTPRRSLDQLLIRKPG